MSTEISDRRHWFSIFVVLALVGALGIARWYESVNGLAAVGSGSTLMLLVEYLRN